MLTPTTILLGGAPEGFDARLLARELEKGAPILHIARDDKRAEAMAAALAVMAPGAVVLDDLTDLDQVLATLGLNWYLNAHAKLLVNYSHTTFDGGAPAGRDRDDEKTLISRLQLAF